MYLVRQPASLLSVCDTSRFCVLVGLPQFFLLSLPFHELSLAFLAFVVGLDVRQQTASDALDHIILFTNLLLDTTGDTAYNRDAGGRCHVTIR